MTEVNYVYNAFVTSVHDGDTMAVNVDLGFSTWVRATLRLARIDTPELTSKDPLERAAAIEARDFVRQRILGKAVVIETHKMDTFGSRYVAEVWYMDGVTQKNLENELRNAGHIKPPGKEQTT